MSRKFGSGLFFASPSSLQRRKLPFMLQFIACAEIIFAPYLSISVYAIKMKHINKNVPSFSVIKVFSFLLILSVLRTAAVVAVAVDDMPAKKRKCVHA